MYNFNQLFRLKFCNSTNHHYATELISLDFDKIYKSDIQTLTSYEQIINGEKKEGERVTFLPLRETGAKLWPEVIKEVQKGNKVK